MQKVEILKALIKGAKILILDEPTAVLTRRRPRELFEQLFTLRDSGVSIIFISHKLEEVMRICSKVTVLRHGQCSGHMTPRASTRASISKLMVGRDVVLKIEKEDPKTGKPVISIKNLVKINSIGKHVIDDISFDIHEGEVVGIAGVEGNGQTELSEVLSGMGGFASGDVLLNDTSIKGQIGARDSRPGPGLYRRGPHGRGRGRRYVHQDEHHGRPLHQKRVQERPLHERQKDR